MATLSITCFKRRVVASGASMIDKSPYFFSWLMVSGRTWRAGKRNSHRLHGSHIASLQMQVLAISKALSFRGHFQEFRAPVHGKWWFWFLGSSEIFFGFLSKHHRSVPSSEPSPSNMSSTWIALPTFRLKLQRKFVTPAKLESAACTGTAIFDWSCGMTSDNAVFFPEWGALGKRAISN